MKAKAGRFVFYENRVSAEHLARHAASSHIQSFRACAAELPAEPARIGTCQRIA